MQAIARRKFNIQEETAILGDFSIDLQKRIIGFENEQIELSRKEFDLLSYLFLHKNRVLTRMQLSEHIWGTYADDDYDSNYIDAHIKNIRKKLNAWASTEWLETVRGVGYRIKKLGVKLSTKLIYFITGSKLAVVLLFILLLPFTVEQIASQYTNYSLSDQQKKVISVVEKNGIDYYLQGEEDYGSYTMLKEEYIALEPIAEGLIMDTIKNTTRIVEQDTLSYRVLSYTFQMDGKNYLLEIGKTTTSISQYNEPLQRIALYVLMGLIALTLIIDLVFTRVLIRPLGKIIQAKLINRKFPFKNHHLPDKNFYAGL